jgi:hypothetical protein
LVTAPAVGQLAVNWATDAAAWKYYVYQSTGGGALSFVASVLDPSAAPPAPTTWTATGLTGGEYCYAIQSQYLDGSMSAIGEQGCGEAVGGGMPADAILTRVIAPNPIGAHPWMVIDVVAGVGNATTNLDGQFTVGDRIREIRVRVVDNTQPGSCVGCAGPTRLISNLRRYSIATGGDPFTINSSAPSNGGGTFQVLTIPVLDIPVLANGDILSLQTIDFSGIAPTTVWSIEVDYQPVTD